MGKLPLNRYRKKNSGLTLIEVLIALAIIAIAMTAIIKASSQSIRATAYLQDKTMGLWVGMRVLNEARLGVLKLPDAPDKLKEKTTLLNRDWYWQAYQTRSPNPHIYQLDVAVFTNDSDEAAAIIQLTSYAYHAN